MSYTDGTAILLNILLLTISIFIGFLFRGRLKVIKYLFWVVSLLLVINLILIIPLNRYYTKKESKYLIGIYELDTAKSRFYDCDIKKFASLKLEVDFDNTFRISKITPFFNDTKGTWTYDDDGDLATITAKFDNSSQGYLILQNDADWEFQSASLTDDKNNNRIVFRRK